MRHVGEYSPAKTGEYPRIFPNFQNRARCEKDLKDNKHNSLHLERKFVQIFVLGHYLFLIAHILLELCSRKTVRYSDQIMSTDKYPSIFLHQMEAIVCMGAYHLAKKSGNFGLKSNGKVIFRKFHSEIVEYLQRYSSFSIRNRTTEISLPIGKFSSFQSLISQKQ